MDAPPIVLRRRRRRMKRHRRTVKGGHQCNRVIHCSLLRAHDRLNPLISRLPYHNTRSFLSSLVMAPARFGRRTDRGPDVVAQGHLDTRIGHSSRSRSYSPAPKRKPYSRSPAHRERSVSRSQVDRIEIKNDLPER